MYRKKRVLAHFLAGIKGRQKRREFSCEFGVFGRICSGKLRRAAKSIRFSRWICDLTPCPPFLRLRTGQARYGKGGNRSTQNAAVYVHNQVSKTLRESVLTLGGLTLLKTHSLRELFFNKKTLPFRAGFFVGNRKNQSTEGGVKATLVVEPKSDKSASKPETLPTTTIVRFSGLR